MDQRNVNRKNYEKKKIVENIPYFHLFSPSLPFLFSVYSVFTIYDADFGKQLLKGRFFENKLFEHSEKL